MSIKKVYKLDVTCDKYKYRDVKKFICRGYKTDKDLFDAKYSEKKLLIIEITRLAKKTCHSDYPKNGKVFQNIPL